MIDLSNCVGKHVALQFKMPFFMFGNMRGSLLPVPEVPTEPNLPPPPRIFYALEGKLSKQGEQYVLSYADPADNRLIVDLVFDSDVVGGCFTSRIPDLAPPAPAPEITPPPAPEPPSQISASAKKK